jgi:tetratricopeptide (TPR) repeat protein
MKRIRTAQAARDAWELEGNPGRREVLRKEALRGYEEAELSYRTAVESEKADQSGLNPEALMEARLEVSRAMIDHAGIDGLEDEVRKDLLRKARSRLVDFEFDFADRPTAFEALLEEGRCLSELGEYQEAESRLRASLTLRKWLAKANAPPTEYSEKIMRGAYVVLAETLARAGRLDEAKTLIDQVLRDEDGLAQTDAGSALKFQKARVLFRMKDTITAKALATELVRQNPGRKWGVLAARMLAEWSNGADRDSSSRDK